ncbi:uncharacterized protein SPPG_03461 [Spizellomyces punctatus DAOM BR117]|uniref:Uncharacterized protein n=1 Tax=Spizellomyces punctatus (strain DAOM BR117) TaxID=645134 RepID=A0A0L0HKU8_SPIPD|nr:uncharacterized protein SPPG_03461 [Spizellomyces punctatus DAOM BR117]KND01663.1 hypothetical protein SPPG_03461 [Spizellomyces punctatus DAOM BR117]|eukprot:XP_016609702.1 hypothetical protein SPPG_03461 [Spizellomyces punctatus DAOM BR117]
MYAQQPNDLPSLKFTSIPLIQGYPNWNPKNVHSTYLKTASSLAVADKVNDNVQPNPDENFSDIIVIHAGSRNLRVGRASDAFPKEVPHVIVRKVRETRDSTEVHQTRSANPGAIAQTFPDTIRDEPGLYDPIQEDIRHRMRTQKIRAVPNAHSQVVGFNSQATPETIPDHNDPYKIEWTELNDLESYIVGPKALRIVSPQNFDEDEPSDSAIVYRAFYPIQHGMLNMSDYTSIWGCLADMETIWSEIIESELGILRSEFGSYNVVWLVPDLFSKAHVREMTTLLLRNMGFRGVTALQESVAATFGAGITTACVIDIGAQKTSISCVEDGMCVADTRVNLKYGGDDITAFLMKLLLNSAFPYTDFNPKKNVYDWLLADELKEKFCTNNEIDMTVNLCNFCVRAPDQPTLLYRIKVYDEVVTAPRVLFHPYVIDFSKKLQHVAFRETYLDYNAEDDTEGDELPHNAGVAAAAAYRSYISHPAELATNGKRIRESKNADSDKFPEGHIPNTTDLEVDNQPSAADVLSVDPKLASPTQGGAIRYEAGGNSAQSPEVTIANTKGFSEAPKSPDDVLQPPPIMHFLRRRRFMGTLSEISFPLDAALAHSVGLYAQTYADMKDGDLEIRVRKLCSSILVVGGGGMVPGLAKLLEERLGTVFQGTPLKERLAAASATGATPALTPRLLQNPRDIDSRVLAWKGGSVFGKLDMTHDLWIGRREWEIGGIQKTIGKWMFGWD